MTTDYPTTLAVLQYLATLQDSYLDERELRKVRQELKEMEAQMKQLLASGCTTALWRH